MSPSLHPSKPPSPGCPEVPDTPPRGAFPLFSEALPSIHSCFTFRSKKSQVVSSSSWDLPHEDPPPAFHRSQSPVSVEDVRSLLHSFPAPRGRLGTLREQTPRSPLSRSLLLVSGVGPPGLSCPQHPPNSSNFCSKIYVMPLGFFKKRKNRVCVKKEGRNPTFIKVLLCGRHIHKHLFLPTLGPGRHLPEGHGEDGKKMKPVKLLSDLSAVWGVDRGQPGFRAQRKRRLEQAEEGHPALVGPVDHRRSRTSFYEQWELVRIRQIWGQIRLGLQKDSVATEWRCVEGHCYTRRSFPALGSWTAQAV